jgi:hypothetical protein
MRRLVEHSVCAIALAAVIALIVPIAATHQSPTHQSHAIATATGSAATLAPVAPAAAAADGRWKLGGDGSCYWDPDDSGPDQCSQTQGRWKLGGDGSCYWDANDSGENQCEPAPSAAPTEARVVLAPFRVGA